jgi:hypothetical protein
MNDYKPTCGTVCYGQMKPCVRIQGQVIRPLYHTADIDSAQERELFKRGRKVNDNTDVSRAGLFWTESGGHNKAVERAFWAGNFSRQLEVCSGVPLYFKRDLAARVAFGIKPKLPR